MSLYLARADRVIIAADLSRAALRARCCCRATVSASTACSSSRSDLHRPGLKPGAFDVVYSSGVLHHTANPRRGVRGGGAARPSRRRRHPRCVQRDRPSSASPPPGCCAVHRIPIRPIRSRVTRTAARTGAARGMAPRSVSASRGTSPHRRGDQGVVFGERVEYLRTFPSTVSERRVRRSLRAGRRRLGRRALDRATRVDVDASAAKAVCSLRSVDDDRRPTHSDLAPKFYR